MAASPIAGVPSAPAFRCPSNHSILLWLGAPRPPVHDGWRPAVDLGARVGKHWRGGDRTAAGVAALCSSAGVTWHGGAPHPRPIVSTTVLGYLPYLASCYGLATVAQATSFSFLKASSKLVLTVRVAGAGFWDENPHVLLSTTMASAGVSTLLEGVVGALLLPCFCPFLFPAWSCSLLC